MAEFKDMLKYFRERENLSQKELAEKLGISASTISMYEVGSRQPNFETEEAIADFFNVDLNTLRGKRINENYIMPDGDMAEFQEAKRLYDLYTQAPPEIQAAVETMLKSQLRDS